MYHTVNYLFAAFLQTKAGNDQVIQRVEKVRPGKAKFYFDITKEEVDSYQLSFHNSCCMEFEGIRKKTIDLAY